MELGNTYAPASGLPCRPAPLFPGEMIVDYDLILSASSSNSCFEGPGRPSLSTGCDHFRIRAPPAHPFRGRALARRPVAAHVSASFAKLGFAERSTDVGEGTGDKGTRIPQFFDR